MCIPEDEPRSAERHLGLEGTPMTPERWAQAKDVLQRAIELPPEKRTAFLDHACAADQALRSEVDSLLVAHEQLRSSFLQSPLATDMKKTTRLGEYEVLCKLGAGGMGEVYRALDMRLRREVAIKILPGCASSDPERLRRFEQEAMAAAALNHPNILAVYQMGTHEGAPYLVSELLEGETLREVINRGRIELRKTIDYGMQITHGLAAAHEKGIVHRDLKPENLFITKDGRAKILDFGLAKLQQPSSASAHSALTLGNETEPGMVMGTAGYMSPEQVRGQTADHRTDIFAFGSVLYEALTGERAFHKPTSAESMTAILREEPVPIGQIAPQTPAALQRIVQRCLEKNPEQRFQSATDLAFALDALSDSGTLIASATAHLEGSSGRNKYLAIAAVVIVALGLISGAYFYLHRPAKLTDKDTIVLADFDNKTGDPVFDDTLRQALSASLRQSPFLNVLSDNKISATLQLMMRPASTRLTPEIVREVCQRADGKAWIGGSIVGIGSQYIVGLRAVNCQNGDTLAQEQVTAVGKDTVLDALGQVVTKLRGQLGESLSSVQKFDMPLSQSTTSSLEALKALTLGNKALYENGTNAAIPFYQHAIELDPDFSAGYVALGKMYSNLGQMARAEQFFTKAYALRQHTSERERFDIESMYHMFVTRDFENSSRVFREWLGSYPRSSAALGNLGNIYSFLGQPQQAVELDRQSLLQRPEDVVGYMNLARSLMEANRLQESRKTIQDAFDHKLDAEPLHSNLYLLALLANDSGGMAEQVAWSEGKPEATQDFLSLQSSVEAYFGHLHKARDLSRRAVEAADRADNKEAASSERMREALSEAAFGNLPEARREAITTLNQPGVGYEAQASAALIFAWLGDAARSQSILDKLGKRFPQGTLVQSVVLPTVRARIELARNNPERAIELLQASIPYELTDVSFNACLYPAYVRGEAYLAAHNSPAAALEFQKVLDHRGLVGPCETAALAHLGLGRAYATGGDSAKAKVVYEDFLTLWKDADPDIPILQQVKSEYSRLH